MQEDYKFKKNVQGYHQHINSEGSLADQRIQFSKF